MGQNCAIAIGINQYFFLHKLKYAENDALAIEKFCKQQLDCKTLYRFSDHSPPIPQDYGPDLPSQPTFANLQRFFHTRFQKPFLTAADNLWFFFAGHGIRWDGQDYLMPIDASKDLVIQTGLSLNDITRRLHRSGAGNVVLLLDACRSEEQAGRRGSQAVIQSQQPGVVTFFSCSSEESSYEIQQLQQGAFTHVLLQGLAIQGEGNCATVERLHQYLRYHVPPLNRRYGKPQQTPYMSADPPTKVHFVLLPKQATLSDVVTLKNDAHEAEADRDLELAEQLWTRVLVLSPGDQHAIKAIKRIARLPASSVKPETPIPSDNSGRGSETVSSPTPTRKSKTLPTFSFEVVTVNAEGTIKDRQKKSAYYYREDLGNGVHLDMVSIPEGEFMMGSPETEESSSDYERPQHLVTVPSFFMGKYSITQAQWKAIVTQVPKIQRDLKPDPSRFKADNRPVERVSWYDAVEFCARLSKYTGKAYSLPSEGQWEYACRAGTTTPFHFGETITTDLVNYDGNYTYGSAPKGEYREETTSVGSFKVANDFGLYDMHGNVWEWCLDDWHSSYEGAPTDGSPWFDNNQNLAEKEGDSVLRGGSWFGYPGICRSAGRIINVPRDVILDLVGFRVVCVVPRTLLSP